MINLEYEQDAFGLAANCFCGALTFWIAFKLLIQGLDADEAARKATNIRTAIQIIMVADITASTDNILALAGASRGTICACCFSAWPLAFHSWCLGARC